MPAPGPPAELALMCLSFAPPAGTIAVITNDGRNLVVSEHMQCTKGHSLLLSRQITYYAEGKGRASLSGPVCAAPCWNEQGYTDVMLNAVVACAVAISVERKPLCLSIVGWRRGISDSSTGALWPPTQLASPIVQERWVVYASMPARMHALEGAGHKTPAFLSLRGGPPPHVCCCCL